MPDAAGTRVIPKLTVLFLCTGNSCRSQMAEGWARQLKGKVIDAYSAGTHLKPLDPLAVQVMAAAGVDISTQQAKSLDAVQRLPFDYVVTVCSDAHESCPVFPGRARIIHRGFDDPPRLAATAKSQEEVLRHYARVRDEIKAFIEQLPEALLTKKGEPPMSTTPENEATREAVRQRYAGIARDTMAETAEEPATSCCAPSCCGSEALDVTTLATSIGYTAEELSDLPAGANMGLSCGNPTAIASLQPGEVILDLGSGGGFDLFLAGPKVGETGRAIGVDMTPDMLALARKNLHTYREHTGLDNVEFRLGEIEHLPVADASVDVVISNCVLNLSPDKPQVWRDIARALKPGGRVAVSDLALLQPLPPAVATMLEALVGCVAGAPLVADTERMMREAGLVDIVLQPKPEYVETMSRRNTPLYQSLVAHIPEGTTPADYLTSLDITARKPA
jgi:arsenite methyltransferase